MTETKSLQSAVIDWLRLPMAVAVVFIHSFGSSAVDMVRLHSDPWSMQSFYDFVRIAGSNVAMSFAVPVFFMISGYLFFFKVKEWNFNVYVDKLRKRWHSLAIPYLLWIVIYIAYVELFKLGGVILHGKPLIGLWEYIIDRGGYKVLWDSALWGSNYVDIFGKPAPMTAPILVPLWFVRDLMVAVIFTPVIYWLIKHLRFLPVLFFGLCYFCRVFIPIHGFSATCFFFFSLGAYFSIYGLNMVTYLSRFRYPAYVIAILSMLILVWVNGRRGNEVTPQPQWVHLLYYVYVLSAVVSVVSIASWLLRKEKVKLNHWLARCTFFIFLSHIIVLGLVSRFTHHFIAPDSWGLLTVEYLFRPFITTGLCIALYWLLERFTPRLLAVLTGGRVR